MDLEADGISPKNIVEESDVSLGHGDCLIILILELATFSWVYKCGEA